MTTIFTQIVNGELPSYKVYEDEICYTFLDIYPYSKGHTLIIPKQEYHWMTDTPDEVVAHIFVVAKQLMTQLKNKL